MYSIVLILMSECSNKIFRFHKKKKRRATSPKGKLGTGIPEVPVGENSTSQLDIFRKI